MNYATFWQRFAAAWIDAFVLLPLTLIHIPIESLSKTAAFIFVIPVTGAHCAYSIYCHGRFGQTVGKYAMGIRVVRTAGERIAWREAWLRSSIDIVFAMFDVVALFTALMNISEIEYYSVRWTQRLANLYALYPPWSTWTLICGNIWVWSEVVVMLFNKQRRALHDFIAGTVVIADAIPSPRS